MATAATPAIRGLALDRRVHDLLRRELGALRAERGAMLGGDRQSGVVRVACVDTTGSVTGVTYTPDHRALARLLADVWGPAGIDLLGFAHSHPDRCGRPSS